MAYKKFRLGINRAMKKPTRKTQEQTKNTSASSNESNGSDDEFWLGVVILVIAAFLVISYFSMVVEISI
jgi:hypothetical protein